MHQGQVPPRPRPGQVEGVTDAALDAEPGVDRPLGGDLGRGAFAQESTLASVGALGVFPDDSEVDRHPGADTGRGDEGPQVDVEVQLEAQPQQQTPLEDTRGHLGGADGAEQDGVEGPQLVQHAVGQHLAGGQIAPAAEVVVGRLERRRRRPGPPSGASATTSMPIPSPGITAILNGSTSQVSWLVRVGRSAGSGSGHKTTAPAGRSTRRIGGRPMRYTIITIPA